MERRMLLMQHVMDNAARPRHSDETTARLQSEVSAPLKHGPAQEMAQTKRLLIAV